MLLDDFTFPLYVCKVNQYVVLAMDKLKFGLGFFKRT